MVKYKKRIADDLIKEKLEAHGALLIEGPKACGKTTSAEHQANSTLYLDDSSKQKLYKTLLETDVDYFLDGDTPRLIDEWQRAPKLWDAIRFKVDHREGTGQFILTGSANPADLSEVSHTGTGRFAWLTMRPMSLWESEESTGQVSLKRLFAKKEKIKGRSQISREDLLYLICRGGWPASVNAPSEKASLRIIEEYFQSIIHSDISRVDGRRRDPQRAGRILRSYARHMGTQISTSGILKDIVSNETSSMSLSTIEDYLKALRKIFVIEDMPAWNPNLRSKTAIRTVDTRYFVDPSVATAALGLRPEGLLKDLPTLGFLCESLCVRDLRVYADALQAQVYHYRDKNNLKCDAVIVLPNGAYGLIEIKLGGETLIEEGAKTLKKLAASIDITRMDSPSFMMVLVGLGEVAYEREDGVLVVPIGALKD